MVVVETGEVVDVVEVATKVVATKVAAAVAAAITTNNRGVVVVVASGKSLTQDFFHGSMIHPTL